MGAQRRLNATSWNGHNRIGSIFNSRASPNQQGLIHPFCWVPLFFGISFSESFSFWPSEGNIQNPTSGNMDLGGLGGRTSRSPISCAAFKAASGVAQVSLGEFSPQKICTSDCLCASRAALRASFCSGSKRFSGPWRSHEVKFMQQSARRKRHSAMPCF